MSNVDRDQKRIDWWARSGFRVGYEYVDEWLMDSSVDYCDIKRIIKINNSIQSYGLEPIYGIGLDE
jgi:hypothetical protein